MKKRIGSIVFFIALGTAFLYSLGFFWFNKTSASKNLFEHAIKFQVDTYTFSPQNVSYGMSMEELLKVKGMKEAEVLNDIVVCKKEMIRNVSDNIDEIVLWKTYYFREKSGLFSVKYSYVVNQEDLEEFYEVLREHALEYMPSGTEIPKDVRIQEYGQGVCWQDMQTENNKRSSYVAVFANGEYYGSMEDQDTKTAVHIQVGVGDEVPLSLLNAEESISFLNSMGIQIAEEFSSVESYEVAVKGFLEALELNPYQKFHYGYGVANEIIEDIREAVFQYYQFLK